MEVAGWLESFGHYDNIADQVRTLPPQTPQGRAGEGTVDVQSPIGSTDTSDGARVQQAAESDRQQDQFPPNPGDPEAQNAVAYAVLDQWKRWQPEDSWVPFSFRYAVAWQVVSWFQENRPHQPDLDVASQEVQNGTHNREAGE